MYHICYLHLDPNTPSGCGFCIKLWPEWREWVAALNITQQQANHAVKVCHRQWLDGCGFSEIYDPDEDPMARWEREKLEKLGKPRKLSKAARPLYGEDAIRVLWGEWGPEHITIPGDACGLDIDASSISAPKAGRSLVPHNVDTIRQAMLLIVVFGHFADAIITRR